MSDLIQATFDYGLLDEGTRVRLQVRAESIRSRLKRTAEDIVAIGQDLIEAKNDLGHGQFIPWLKAEFDMTEMSAVRFMQVAKRFGEGTKSNNLLDLSVSVLYELAAPSTPETVVSQVQSGEIPPTLEAIKAAKEAEKQARIAEAKARADAQASQQMLLNLTESSQSEIEQLTKQIEDLKKEMEELTTPEVEIREVPKEVIPQSVTNQLETLQKKLASITDQSKKYQETNKAMQERIEKLNGELQAAIRARVATENDERIRQQWRHITSEAHSCLMRLLGSWPTPLDIRSFDADDWARLDYLKQTLKRVLEECTNLQYDSPAEVPIAYIESGTHA